MTMKRSPFSICSERPVAAIMTPSFWCCMELTKMLRTWVESSATASTNTTRWEELASLKAPGETWAVSSRFWPVSFCRYSALIFRAQGEISRDSRAMLTTTGRVKVSTGRTQAVRDWPEANHTTISESR